MTPAARVAAAIKILDEVLDGAAVEKVLTNWGRSNRYAGSGDRAAVRDHVFDVLRNRDSYEQLGGTLSGRGLMIGALRKAETPLETIFDDSKYGNVALNDGEILFIDNNTINDEGNLNIPPFVVEKLSVALGDKMPVVAAILQTRAPLFLRVNLQKTNRDDAIAKLLQDEVTSEPHALSPTALLVTKNPRRAQNSEAFRLGLVEIQDAASQAITDLLPLNEGDKVLDYCAGGGGKSLAIAGRAQVSVTAHDQEPRRMRDIPFRADRAGVHINRVDTVLQLVGQKFDLVLCDVPCSGSGAWRRSPQSKWLLTSEKLTELNALQLKILSETQDFVDENGCLAYVTCSLFRDENQDVIAKFLTENPSWELKGEHIFTPDMGGDGFYFALLTRD